MESWRQKVSAALTGASIPIKGKRYFLTKANADELAARLSHLEPKNRQSNVSRWIGYDVDRKTVLYTVNSRKADIIKRWCNDNGISTYEVSRRGDGIYFYSHIGQPPDFKQYQLWVVRAGTEGFG